MFDVGRVCVKVAGKESGNVCVVVDKIDNKNVLIDGNVKRKHCNVAHLEPTPTILKIKKGASTAEVKKALATESFEVVEKKGPKTKKAEKPIKLRNAPPVEEKKPAKKEKAPAKKETKKAGKK